MARDKLFESVGHGGRDPGAVSGNFIERDMNLIYATAFHNEVSKYDEIEPLLSRTSNDMYVSVGELVAASNNWGSKYHIAFHLNAGGGDGCEVIYSQYSEEGRKLAQFIATEIMALGQNAHGQYTKTITSEIHPNKDYLAENRDTNAISVVIEPAFIDSPDVEFVDTTEELETLGVAIAHGFLKYCGIYREEPAVIEQPAPVTPGYTELVITSEVAAVPMKKVFTPDQCITAVGSVGPYYIIDIDGDKYLVDKSCTRVK